MKLTIQQTANSGSLDLCAATSAIVWCLVMTAITSLAAETPKAASIKTMHGSMSLEQKVRLIQHFTEAEQFGPRVIPCSIPYDGGNSGSFRPWIVSDFNDQSTPHLLPNRKGGPVVVTAADWLNNENSMQFTGQYLLSQVFRFEATKDPAALVECERAVRAVQAVASLAGPERFGWICKPLGEKLQEATSPDQNICVAVGLFCYLPHASPAEAVWIRKLIPAMAAHWERIEYKIEFYDKVWDVKESAGHMRIFLLMNRMAEDITNDGTYKKVADRLEAQYGDLDGQSASLFDTAERTRPGIFRDWLSCKELTGASLMFAPWHLHVMCKIRPESKPQYLAAWERVLRHGLLGYSREHAGHYHQTLIKREGKDFAWRPLETKLPPLDHEELVRSEKWAFHRYDHQILWLDPCGRLSAAYLAYLQNGGTKIPEVESVVHEIMKRLDYTRCHVIHDPGGDQTIPELKYMLHMMSSELPNYIATYYLGKRQNFWK